MQNSRNAMNKKFYIYLLLAVIAIIGLLIWVFYQFSLYEKEIARHTQEFENITGQNDSLVEKTIFLNGELEKLDLDIAKLQVEIKEKDGYIADLRETNHNLEKEREELNGIIRLIQDSLARSENPYVLNELQKLQDFYKAKADSLELSVSKKQGIIDSILFVGKQKDRQLDSLMRDRIDLSVRVKILEIENNKLDSLFRKNNISSDRVDSIVNYLDVEIVSVKLGKDTKGKREVNKVRSGIMKKSHWVFTEVGLKLRYHDINILKDYKFGARIRDLDNNKYVVNNEGLNNKNYLQYISVTDQALKIRHINYRPKTGDNYNLQIVIIVNGKELPISDGTFPLFIEGERVRY